MVQTTGSETGVNLLTSHGSKGLEFEHVFLIGARHDVWEGKGNRNRGFRLPPNVFEMETEAEMVEEQRRLFFVSVTRAEKYLYISYPKMTNEGKELIPSQFSEEIRLPLNLQPATIVLPDEEKLLFQSLRFGMVQKPVLLQMEKEYVDGLLKNFVMNVTALNNYLDCPLRFYYNTLIKIPYAKSEAAQFGTAVHDALHDFIIKMAESGRIYPDKNFLVTRFVFHLNTGREVFTKESPEVIRGERVIGHLAGNPGHKYNAGLTCLNEWVKNSKYTFEVVQSDTLEHNQMTLDFVVQKK